MASKGAELGLVLALSAMLWITAAAQSGCTRALMSLAPCLKYVTAIRRRHRHLAALSSAALFSHSLAAFVHCSTAQPLVVCRLRRLANSQCNAAPNAPTASAITPAEWQFDPTMPSVSDTPSAGIQREVEKRRKKLYI
ncbi:uncharacterized protein LOC127786786 [Diospyros lotus]|uniref:uncharacterized protein LOC127786786 n=1 Tax=Diospyros lotus TaxID=55363 RepID=UPI002250BB31|nr:uncharacterized protein LOC127786786 [Diospyros lotus]